jgi:hypothetical protein
MIHKFFTLIFCLTLVSCGKKETRTEAFSNSGIPTPAFELTHKRVKELFVVVFDRDYSADEWKSVFDLTRILSLNKKALRQSSGDVAAIIQKNAEILTDLSAMSVFMLSWSAQDENCKFIQKDELLFNCKPRNFGNPLNGGLPVSTEPVKWVIPDPIRSDVKTPYLKMSLKKESNLENHAEYELLLRMKLESANETETVFKGEVIPVIGSRFLKSDGSTTDQFFPYGYVELSLGK